MKKKLNILIWVLSFYSITFAQSRLTGLVVNEYEEKLPFATLSELLSSNDSLVNIVLSDSLGKFAITSYPGKSYLYVTNIGYQPKKVDLSSGLLNLKIVLERDASFTLDEVEIKAQRPVLKIETDRLVYDLSANPFKNDFTIEALKYVPLIKADNEGISIVGKDMTQIYINGRKSPLSGEALMAYLRTLPAGNIKNIEVITTPNSTFRGEGNFGVINILLKNSENEGLKGSVFAQLWKTHYFKQRTNVNLNYQKQKLITNFAVGISNTSDWKNNSIETVYKETGLNTFTHTLTDGDGLSYYANLAADYQWNENNIIGLLIAANLSKDNWSETGITQFKEWNSNNIDSLMGIHYKSKSYNPELAVNMNYRTHFDNNRQSFFVDLDYLHNYNKQESKNRIDYLDEDENDISPYQDFQQISPQKTNIWSGKIEYGNNLNSQLNFKLGLDAYYSVIKNDDKYNNRINGVYVKDSLRSNNFEINEWTPAFFLHVNKGWNEKISTSLGARLEYTRYKGIQHTSREKFQNNYFNFLPNFYISYAPSVNHKINYNLSYRVIRPGFSFLNPFIVYVSPTSYSTGNPFLKAAKRISNNLQYLFLNKYYLTFSYSEIHDRITGIQTIKENNMIEAKAVNLGKQKDFSIQFYTKLGYLEEKAFLNINASYNWGQTRGGAEGVYLDYISQYFNVNINNYYLISKKYDLSLDLGMGYTSKQKLSNREYPSSLQINAQLKKTINDWTITIYGNMSGYIYDSKLSQKWKLGYETDEMQEISYRWGEPNNIGLRLTYNFGNSKVKSLDNRNTSNSEVRSRIQ